MTISPVKGVRGEAQEAKGVGSLELHVAVWGCWNGALLLQLAGRVGCGPPSSALTPPLTKLERTEWPLPSLLPMCS